MPKRERCLAWGCKSSRVSASGCTIVVGERARVCTVWERARVCPVDDYVAKVVADIVVLFVNNCWYHLVLLSTRRRYDYWLVAVLDPTPPGLDSVSVTPPCLPCHATFMPWCRILLLLYELMRDCLLVYSLWLRYLRVHHCTHTGFSCSQVLDRSHLLLKSEDCPWVPTNSFMRRASWVI